MATLTHVHTLTYVARILGEDPERLEAITDNDDNLDYGDIITVWAGPEETMTALTDDGIDGLRDLLADARRSPEAWQDFLQSFVDDPELRARLASAEPQAWPHAIAKRQGGTERSVTDRMALLELIEKHADTDLVHEMPAFAADRIMEVTLRTGAAKGARSPLRVAQRNGYRERDWDTRAGRIAVGIPKVRKGPSIASTPDKRQTTRARPVAAARKVPPATPTCWPRSAR